MEALGPETDAKRSTSLSALRGHQYSSVVLIGSGVFDLFVQLIMLHSSLALEPRTLFILHEEATGAARHVEPQGMTSNSMIITTCNVNSVKSRLLRRGVACAGRERH